MTGRLAFVFSLAVGMFGPPSAEAQRVFSCDGELRGDLIYRCLGAAEGRERLLEELERRPDDDVIDRVAQLAFDDARAPLRRLLRDPELDEFTKSHVAQALLTLGDDQTVSELVDLARGWEDGHSSAWERTVEALAAHGHAAAYALDRVGRIESPVRGARDENHLLWALPVLVDADRQEALPILQRLSDGEEARDIIHAPIMAARIRLGDATLSRRIRTQLQTPNAPVPVSPHHYWGALDAPADTAALLRGARSHGREAVAAYEGIERLTRGHSAAQLGALRRGLEETLAFREDTTHMNFGVTQLAYHHLALARLGRRSSAVRLIALAGGPETRVGTVVAARGALEVSGDEGQRAAVALLRRASASLTGPEGTAAQERMGRVGTRDYSRDERAALVAALADTSSTGWTVALLDRHPTVRDAALYQLARRRPEAACTVVTERASDPAAAEDGVQHGLLALTVLDDDCEDALESLAVRDGVRNVTRGVAIEVLAMMGSGELDDLDERYRHHRWIRASIERARDIREQVD